MPEPKLGSVSPEMRHVLSLTGLGTAVGAGAGALTADEGHRLEGAALGGLAGGAYSAGIGGTQAGVAHTFLPEVARADALRSIRSIGDLALQGGVSGLIGGTAASTLTSDAPESKIAAILRKTAATLRAEHAADQQSKIATAQHTVRAAAALHTLRT